MPDSPPKARFDAVICDQQYPAGASDKLIARNQEFGPLLGAARVVSRHVPGNRSLVTAPPAGDVGSYHPGEFHPKEHPQAGQPRYDWMDRGDGVLYGVLLDAPDAAAPEDTAKTLAAMAAKRKEALEAQIAGLKAVEPRSAVQDAELARLNAWHARLHGRGE